MVIFIGQLSGRKSLRDLVMNVTGQTGKLFYLAIKQCFRATLARVNDQQPAQLYEAVFHKLLQKTRQFAPKHRYGSPPKNFDPVVLHEPTRKSVDYFGAVRLRDTKFVHRREDDKFNADSFWCFLKQLRRASSHSCNKVNVITDNARYNNATLHKQYRETCADRFALVFLPQYSPHLNPIERVWRLIHKCSTHNPVFPDIGKCLPCSGTQIQRAPGSDVLRKLCAIN